MKLVEELLEISEEDTKTLFSLDKKGDDFNKSRTVDFTFSSEDNDKLNIVADFITDNNYGKTEIQYIDENDYRFGIPLIL